jgi:phosphatidylglycerophosphate synthase
MPLRFRECADAVHELECLAEARELERALEGPVDLCPLFGSHDASIYDQVQVAVSTERVSCIAATRAGERRAGREVVLEVLFRPLSNLLVPALARTGIAPSAVVVANAVTGLLAALALARGSFLAAALLLQLKTLLDNSDGQLARMTGRVTLAGRYLDTEADLVVNAALFTALAYVTGQPLLTGAAFVTLTLVLAIDFNVTELYRERRGLAVSQPPRAGGRAEVVLGGVYAATFAQLDRFFRWFSERRFERLVAAGTSPAHVRQARLEYVDRVAVTVLANLGLTTQLFVLGACLALGLPQAYLWLVLACAIALAPLQVRAERRARAALRLRRAV